MHRDDLKGKKILFFSPAFFGYEDKIRRKMSELGAIVDAFDERSISSNFHKAILKVTPNIFNRRTEKYYFDILNRVKQNEYDYILFIKCEMATENVLTKYKEYFPEAKLCLHMWDSIKNIPNIQNKFKYFDHITSFDRDDFLKNKIIKFRPLFYCDEYKREVVSNINCKYDLCFIGTIHSDRYKILKEIEDQAKKMNLSIYFYPYLQSKFIYYFYKIVKKKFRDSKVKDFRFKKINSNDIVKIVEESKIIIDIQHPMQTGLTMRTIEILGMNKKIITTNKDIVNYDFYNSENIQVIDRERVEINLKKLNNSYNQYSHIEKYSLKYWIFEVLGYEK